MKLDRVAAKTGVLADEAYALLKQTRHRRVTDKRVLMHASLTLAVAVENLRDSARLLRKLTA